MDDISTSPLKVSLRTAAGTIMLKAELDQIVCLVKPFLFSSLHLMVFPDTPFAKKADRSQLTIYKESLFCAKLKYCVTI